MCFQASMLMMVVSFSERDRLFQRLARTSSMAGYTRVWAVSRGALVLVRGGVR